MFGEAEMDKQSPDLGHGADRDSHFRAARQVPLPEEHVGYLVAARFRCLPYRSGVAVMALGLPPHRARGGHDLLIRRGASGYLPRPGL